MYKQTRNTLNLKEGFKHGSVIKAALGFVFGAILGLIIGNALGSAALGLILGAGVGLIWGSALDRRHANESNRSEP